MKFDVSGREVVIPFLNDQLEDEIDGGYTREVVQRILAAKDEGLVRDKAFHELRMPSYPKMSGVISHLFQRSWRRGGTRIKKSK